MAQHPIDPIQGGTGISNNNASTVTISGSSALTITLTGATNVTFPTTGTLITSATSVTASQMPAFSGDASSSAGATVLTLATVNSNVGTFASVTVNGKGLVTAATALSGDLTTSGAAATLATVNSNVGTFGDASHVGTFTVNGKGLVTAASSTSIAIASGAVSGLAASATTDTTNASNISSGTLPSGRLTGVYSGVTGLGAQSQALNMNSNLINNVSTPVSNADAANKAYVDALGSGITWKNSVKASTTANLSGTYVGSPTFTLTNNSTQAAFAVDGYSASSGDRILVKNQTTQSQNGIYSVTTVGTGSTNWVLTRTSDFNEVTPIDEINGAAVYVQQGTLNANTGWTQIDHVATFDTDPIAWAQFSGTGSGVSSLTGTANQISVSSPTGAVTLSIPSAFIAPGSVEVTTTLKVDGNTASSFLYSNATKQVVTTTAPTNGQLLIGSTGAIPVVAALTGTSNQVTITNGAGSITLSVPSTFVAPGSIEATTTVQIDNNTAKAFLYSDASKQVASTAAPTNGQLLVGSTGNIPVAATLTGTANQLTVTNGAGSITLSVPSTFVAPGSIEATSTVQIDNNTAKSFVYSDASKQVASTSAPTNGQLLIGSTGNIPVAAALTGTANQITVTNGAGSITLSVPANTVTTGQRDATVNSNSGTAYTTGTITVDFSAGNVQRILLGASGLTINFTNVPTTQGQAQTMTLILVQNSSTARTLPTFSQTINWDSGLTPVLTSGTANQADILQIVAMCITSGTTVYAGGQVMGNVAGL